MNRWVGYLIYLAAVVIFLLLLVFVFPPEWQDTLLNTELGYLVIIGIMLGIGVLIYLIQRSHS